MEEFLRLLRESDLDLHIDDDEIKGAWTWTEGCRESAAYFASPEEALLDWIRLTKAEWAEYLMRLDGDNLTDGDEDEDEDRGRGRGATEVTDGQ